MEWNLFVDWAFKAILGGIVFYGVHVLSEMKKSIDTLNSKVSQMIERTEWHTKEIDRLEFRISRIEEKAHA